MLELGGPRWYSSAVSVPASVWGPVACQSCAAAWPAAPPIALGLERAELGLAELGLVARRGRCIHIGCRFRGGRRRGFWIDVRPSLAVRVNRRSCVSYLGRFRQLTLKIRLAFAGYLGVSLNVSRRSRPRSVGVNAGLSLTLSIGIRVHVGTDICIRAGLNVGSGCTRGITLKPSV